MHGDSWGQPPATREPTERVVPMPSRERDELVDRVTVNVREHNRSTILLGSVFARGDATDGPEHVEVIGSGNTLAFQVNAPECGTRTREFRVDIAPLVEAAVKAYRRG